MTAARVTDLDLPDALLDGLGASRVQAVPEPDPATLVPLLSDLAAEECCHTWRTWLPRVRGGSDAERAARVLHQERVTRPTTVWAYVADTPVGRRTLGVATLSSRVRDDFPHEGFPVLARAYIRPAHRGRGLYPHMLRHRLARCQARWGWRLQAVHIGATGGPVDRVVARTDLPLRFVHVGDEDLRIAGRVWRVRDHVAFTHTFMRSVPAAPPGLRTFLREGAASVPWGSLRPRLAHPVAAGPHQLRDLLDAIGVCR